MHDSVGVCGFSHSGRILYCSHTFGAFRREELDGAPFWVGCDDPDAIRSAFATCMFTGRPVSASAKVTDPEGVTREVNYTFYALPEDQTCRVISVWHVPLDGPPLSPRERQVVSALAEGKRLEEIADALLVSASTVKSALRSALQKTGARTSAQLVALAVRAGIC